MKLPIPESYWVEPGRFLAGEYPGSYNIEVMRQRINAFLEAGIDTFIDLTQPHELISYEPILKEQAGIYKLDAIYHRIAIRDHHIPSPETMTHLLNTIDEALNTKRKVYVHCWGGIGRTGTAVACHLVRHGKTNEEALAQVDELFKTRPKNFYYPRSPETDEQIQFVREWREIAITEHKSKQNFCEG